MIKYNGENSMKKLLALLKAKFDTKVDKVEGKGLSTNDYTTAEKEKLGGIEAGAQVNVKADWNATEGDAQILNKPTLGTLAAKSQVAETDLEATLKAKVNAAAEGNHSHDNKALLDTYTQTEENLADAVAKKHNHANKAVLDGITAEKVADWDDAVAKEHEHANKAELDLIQTGDKAKWDAAEQNAKDYADGIVEELEGTVTEIGGKVTTLIGSDANKSVRTIANEELAAQLVADGAKESLDTLAEIAAWIQSHPDDASAMNEAITALQSQMTGIAAGEGTVKKYVDDAIAALKIGDYAKAADLTALAARVTTAEGKITALEGKVDTGDKTVTQYIANEFVEYTDTEVQAMWDEVFTA